MLLWGGNMKWSINELNKFRLTNHTFEYTADFHAFVTEDLIDLIDISDVEVSGSFQVIEAFEQYLFDLTIKCTLTLACAITLQPVDVPMNFQTSVIFSKTFVDDSVYLIEGNTVDLDPIVWSNILIEKPMKVVAENAYDHYSEDIITLDEDEKIAANPFGKLKK